MHLHPGSSRLILYVAFGSRPDERPALPLRRSAPAGPGETAGLLRELLAVRGLQVGDDAYLFPAPKGESKRAWSRWHVGRLPRRAEKAAEIAHIGGLHAWRRKWHTERKHYPTQDVAAAAGYADPRSVERYRHADPETTYRVVTQPTVVVRRSAAPSSATASMTADAPKTRGATSARPSTARAHRAPRQATVLSDRAPTAPATGVGQGRGSAARSVMPDGTIVESRDERFEVNLAAARAYAAEHGHLLPKKHERPVGVNLLMWLKNQEIRLEKGTLPPERRAQLDEIEAWRDRLAKRGIVARDTEGSPR